MSGGNATVSAGRVLVTGASQGIGRSTVLGFAKAGFDVVAVARSKDALATLTDECRGLGADCRSIAGDLSERTFRSEVFESIGDIDVLVNNAGAIPGGSLDAIDIGAWEAAWSLKVFGYVHMTQMALSRMAAAGSGVIVNVIGTGGRKPTPDYVCGAAANAALIAFTEAVGGGSPAAGVRVLGINPGPTLTPRLYGDPSLPLAEARQSLATRMPEVRILDADQVAEVITFLASPAAGSLSGTVIDCDLGELHRAGAAFSSSIKRESQGAGRP